MACGQAIVQTFLKHRTWPDQVQDITQATYMRLLVGTSTQEILLAAYKASDMDYVRAILLKVARSALIDDARKTQRFLGEGRYEGARGTYSPPESSSPENQLVQIELRADIMETMSSIPGATELQLYLQGFTHTEIKHMVGAPSAAAVCKRIARALDTARRHPGLQKYDKP